MPETTEATYLSIGEVLGLLLVEFPDITISKIRFLESQGLISPERTASGYRKFYEDDVELLRVILTEQREHYLPLRVIKDRLDSGEIDPTGENNRPPGESGDRSGGVTLANASAPGSEPAVSPGESTDRGGAGREVAAESEQDAEEVPAASIRSHPSSRASHSPTPATDPSDAGGGAPDTPDPPAGAGSEQGGGRRPRSDAKAPAPNQLLPGVLLDRSELCAMVAMTDEELTQLESFGILGPRAAGGQALYGDDAVSIAKPAVEFLRMGVDARHLRGWRTSAERETSLFEQLVTPRYRQRNPEARAEALAQLRRLDELGATLRNAITRQALRHHFES